MNTLPYAPAPVNAPAKRRTSAFRPDSREAVARERYREMVEAVRRWLDIKHPGADMIAIHSEDEFGMGEVLASFHREPRHFQDQYTRGDAMADRAG